MSDRSAVSECQALASAELTEQDRVSLPAPLKKTLLRECFFVPQMTRTPNGLEKRKGAGGAFSDDRRKTLVEVRLREQP